MDFLGCDFLGATFEVDRLFEWGMDPVVFLGQVEVRVVGAASLQPLLRFHDLLSLILKLVLYIKKRISKLFDPEGYLLLQLEIGRIPWRTLNSLGNCELRVVIVLLHEQADCQVVMSFVVVVA